MEDRSKRNETVRPTFVGCCEKQRECDSVLSATNVENDVEFNDETDDEDMEDGEMGFDERAGEEHPETMEQFVFRVFCPRPISPTPGFS